MTSSTGEIALQRALFIIAILTLSVEPATATPEPTRFTLPNGLRVILRPVQGAQNVVVVVQFDIGGNQDPPERSGLAHLIEHAYCTAAAGSTSARTAEQYMAGGGNAQTGDDFTF